MSYVRHLTENLKQLDHGLACEIGSVVHVVGQVAVRTALGLQRVLVAAPCGAMRGPINIQSADRSNPGSRDVERLRPHLGLPPSPNEANRCIYIGFDPRCYLYIPAVYTDVPAGGDDEGDEDFLALLDWYLDEPHDPNPAMQNVRVLWVEDDSGMGALHIANHNATKEEVEQVLFEIPPVVQAKRSRQFPERTLFWGATRRDRWIFIVCEDWTEGSVRYLKPITAFEPDEGEHYWRTR